MIAKSPEAKIKMKRLGHRIARQRLEEGSGWSGKGPVVHHQPKWKLQLRALKARNNRGKRHD